MSRRKHAPRHGVVGVDTMLRVFEAYQFWTVVGWGGGVEENRCTQKVVVLMVGMSGK